jgi:hypothetical protein
VGLDVGDGVPVELDVGDGVPAELDVGDGVPVELCVGDGVPVYDLEELAERVEDGAPEVSEGVGEGLVVPVGVSLPLGAAPVEDPLTVREPVVVPELLRVPDGVPEEVSVGEGVED